MQLPQKNASYVILTNYGSYVGRRLQQAKLLDLAASVKAATDAIKHLGRARDDAEQAIQEALADRDAIDDTLDVTAQTNRANLAGRDPNASKKTPYTEIYPDGIAYYIAAPLDQQEKRYTEFASRLEAFLPAADPLRAEHIPVIVSGIAAFTAASKALDTARNQKLLLATQLDSAEDAWRILIERTYGALIERFGKGKRVEGFFPKL